MSDYLQPHELQYARLPCPSESQSLLKLVSLNQWCHPAISSSVVPFSFCLQSFPASGSFPMRQLFASGVQSTGASASASVFPMNIRGWFPLDLISLLSKKLSRVFSNTTVHKTINLLVLSLLYGPTLTMVHSRQEDHVPDSMDLCWQSAVSAC